MGFDLHTRVRAVPKVTTDLMKDFIRKEDLEQNYVDKDTFSSTLEGYVKDVEGSSNVLYARTHGKWVQLKILSEGVDTVIYTGLVEDEAITAEILESGKLQKTDLVIGCDIYNIVTTESEENAYFYVVCSKELNHVHAANGLAYKVDMTECEPIEIALNEEGEDMITLHCYRSVLKLRRNIQWKFDIELK